MSWNDIGVGSYGLLSLILVEIKDFHSLIWE